MSPIADENSLVAMFLPHRSIMACFSFYLMISRLHQGSQDDVVVATSPPPVPVPVTNQQQVRLTIPFPTDYI